MPEPTHIHIGPEGAAFYKAVKDARDNAPMETELRRIDSDDLPGYQWEAVCVDYRIPGFVTITGSSDKGPLDALRNLKEGLAMLGLPCRPGVTNIVRVLETLDD